MSCRIFVARTNTGAWSLWIETGMRKSQASTGISLSLAHAGIPLIESTPYPLSQRAIVVGWLPDHSFARHRAWAYKFKEGHLQGEDMHMDSLEFVLHILDDAYVEHYLDVLPTRETLEALLLVDDSDREEQSYAGSGSEVAGGRGMSVMVW